VAQAIFYVAEAIPLAAPADPRRRGGQLHV
jgi:hypothetical protein